MVLTVVGHYVKRKHNWNVVSSCFTSMLAGTEYIPLQLLRNFQFLKYSFIINF